MSSKQRQHYTNDLHEALISKSGDNFWKCWNSKFEKGNKSCKFIGLADDVQIAEGSTMSYFYELKTGVRQGGVLSPSVIWNIY